MISGYCKKDKKHYAINEVCGSVKFNTNKHFAVCPDCMGNLTLNHCSLGEVKKSLHLSASEASDKVAGFKNQ